MGRFDTRQLASVMRKPQIQKPRAGGLLSSQYYNYLMPMMEVLESQDAETAQRKSTEGIAREGNIFATEQAELDRAHDVRMADVSNAAQEKWQAQQLDATRAADARREEIYSDQARVDKYTNIAKLGLGTASFLSDTGILGKAGQALAGLFGWGS